MEDLYDDIIVVQKEVAALLFSDCPIVDRGLPAALRNQTVADLERSLDGA